MPVVMVGVSMVVVVGVVVVFFEGHGLLSRWIPSLGKLKLL
jgi:hypothetical protein